MPGLSFPFIYECSGCRNETTVTRGDARGLYPIFDSSNAAEVVLEQRGWMRGEVEKMLLCPERRNGARRRHADGLPLRSGPFTGTHFYQ